jgi:hypothetical protein
MNHEGRYINFHLRDQIPGRETSIWYVHTKSGEALGYINWYGPWRKYCFYPGPGSGFEEVCMREISDFIVARTKEHKSKSKEIAA